jgi:hypothetical protein
LQDRDLPWPLSIGHLFKGVVQRLHKAFLDYENFLIFFSSNSHDGYVEWKTEGRSVATGKLDPNAN